MLGRWFRKLLRIFTFVPQSKFALRNLLKKVQANQVIDYDTLKMMEGVLQVSEMKVADIMVPRSQMVVVQKDAQDGSFLKEIIESAHSRFPVIGSNKDEVTGILLAKDCLKVCFQKEPFDIQKILRPALFVPENKRLDAMLKEFKASRNHMAIVMDEYGGVAGLVTIEDVLEQIVGEIEDEYDLTSEEEYIKPQAKGVYVIHALTPLEEFNQYFHSTLSIEEFDTIGGLVLHAFGRLPKRGENIKIGPYQFTVLQADNRRIRLLRMEI